MIAAGLRVRGAMRVLPLRPGEPCGDAAVLHALPGGAWLAVIVDGLGHGAAAAEAAQAALLAIAQAPAIPLQQLMQRLQQALCTTRGAAVGLLRLAGGGAEHAGLGNTRTLRWRDGQLHHVHSQHGIAGGGLPAQLEIQPLDLQPGDCVLMTTDGLDERLRLPLMLPEWRRDPALLCEHLLAQAGAGQDDAGVLVLQLEAS